MSHSTEINTTTFFHNGEYEGDVTIVTAKGSLEVPYEHLEYLVGERVRQKLTSDIEELSTEELLGIDR